MDSAIGRARSSTFATKVQMLLESIKLHLAKLCNLRCQSIEQGVIGFRIVQLALDFLDAGSKEGSFTAGGVPVLMRLQRSRAPPYAEIYCLFRFRQLSTLDSTFVLRVVRSRIRSTYDKSNASNFSFSFSLSPLICLYVSTVKLLNVPAVPERLTVDFRTLLTTHEQFPNSNSALPKSQHKILVKAAPHNMGRLQKCC